MIMKEWSGLGLSNPQSPDFQTSVTYSPKVATDQDHMSDLQFPYVARKWPTVLLTFRYLHL